MAATLTRHRGLDRRGICARDKKMNERYRHDDLIAAAAGLYRSAGLDGEIARVVAEILVEADLLGYTTHGLQFMPAYLAQLEGGKWTTSGAPEIVADNGAALRLDGRGLPGQWNVVKALELALERSTVSGGAHPVVSVAIGRSQNISCLATYCRRAAEAGAMALLVTSSPGATGVAPAGGRGMALSTSPIAAGIPARSKSHDHPILFDMATSATTNRALERTRREGGKLPYKSLVDADGNPTDDPEAFYTEPPGAILPMGGIETGHKGTAISILIEALTSGLAGWGRAPGEEKSFGNNVFLQLIDPGAFAGADAFTTETGHLAETIRNVPPMAGTDAVRVPGDRAYRLWREQTEKGVELHPEILPRMAPWFEKYGVAAPNPI
jgi:LDH2 family malate/lactate/ureidoglycolate dehydrogenase